MQWIEVIVGRRVQETPVDRRFTLAVPTDRAEAFAFRPGQHVLARVAGSEGDVEGALSISSRPGEPGGLDLTVRNSGRFGERFYALDVGARVALTPPRGTFLLEAPPGAAAVLFAGGSGVTPFRALVRHLRATGHAAPVTLVLSARGPDQLLFDAEWRQHAAACPWFAYRPTVTRAVAPPERPARAGRVDAALVAEVVGGGAGTRVMACGPTVFVEAVERLVEAAGVPADHVLREKWG